MAKTTLIGLGMRVTQERDGRKDDEREEGRAGNRVSSHGGEVIRARGVRLPPIII
jgi:hypothetical protein